MGFLPDVMRLEHNQAWSVALAGIAAHSIPLVLAGRRGMPRRVLEEEGLAASTIAIIAASCAVVLTIIGIVVFFLIQKKNGAGSTEKIARGSQAGSNRNQVVPTGTTRSTASPSSSPGRSPSGKGHKSPSSRALAPVFSVADVQKMTNNWSPAQVIEDAGHSTVFKGKDDSGAAVVVKRAKKASKGAAVIFRNEVKFLAELNHPHIVPFLGSCDAAGEEILVFEYIQNGALSAWLRPRDDRQPLNFRQRVKIAVEVAEALAFIHSTNKMHRDVKSDTILLTKDFEAMLGGLGLLKHMPGVQMRARMERKKGYLDQESYQGMKATDKCDVFAYGVVLLELITAKPPILEVEDEEGAQSKALVFWVAPYITSNRVEAIADPRMGLQGHEVQLLNTFAHVAGACVAQLRKSRPNIKLVLGQLKEIDAKQ